MPKLSQDDNIYIKDSYFSIYAHTYKHVRSPQVYLLLVFMLKMIFRYIHTSPQDETETDVADINENMKDRPLDRNKTPLTRWKSVLTLFLTQ